MSSWQVVDLGFLASGALLSEAYGINDSGIISGYTFFDPINPIQATPIRGSSGNYLNILEPGYPPNTLALGFRINSAGHICGYGDKGPGDLKAARWDAYIPTELDRLAACNEGVGWDINDSDLVVGECRLIAGSLEQPTYWTGTSVFTLALPGGDNQGIAFGVNNAGQMVGFTSTAGGRRRPAYWAPGISTLAEQAGASVSTANDINTSGQIVGTGNDGTGSDRALRWNDYLSSPVVLGLPAGYTDTYAKAINETGEIVGYGYDASVNQIPLFWDVDGIPTELPLLGGCTQGYVNDLNNGGQLVGVCISGGNTYYSVLWTLPKTPTILSTVATIDHDVLIGVEKDQHHAEIHQLKSQVDHTGGFIYKRGVSPIATDADVSAVGQTAADGMVAITFDTNTAITLIWTRLGGSWSAVEAS